MALNSILYSAGGKKWQATVIARMKQQTPSLEIETVKTAIYEVDETSRRGMKKAWQLKLREPVKHKARHCFEARLTCSDEVKFLPTLVFAIIENCNRTSGKKLSSTRNFTSLFTTI